MESAYKTLGSFVRLVDERNRSMTTTRILGINIDKYFMPSVANTIGTDLSNYKLLRKGLFACNPMHVGRDERLPIALYTDDVPAIVSPAYFVFEVTDNSVLDEYLMMWFLRPDFDRLCWFKTDASVRGGISWDDLSRIEIPFPPIDAQRKLVYDYKVISDRIALKRRINACLEEMGLSLFQHLFQVSENKLPSVPLYDLAGFINGTSFSEDEYADTGIPIIKIAELKNGISGDTAFFSGVKESKFFIDDGDILFSWSGNPETSIDAFIWTHGQGILNQHTFKMECTNGRVFTFFMLKYRKPEFIKAAKGKQTTGLGHVTVKDLKRLTIPFDAKTANIFNREATPFFEGIFNNLKEINILTEWQQNIITQISAYRRILKDDVIQAAKDALNGINVFGPFRTAEEAVASMLED